jgi:hypothetical protein
LLVGYWALLTFVPVPGLGAASYQPETNLANWVDLYYRRDGCGTTRAIRRIA